MEQIVFGGILAFIITLFSIPKIIYVSEKKNLFDNPDAARKFHNKPTSPLGGLAIFLGFIISILLTDYFFQFYEFQYYIASFILIFFVGLKDDVLEISAVKKFICQSLIACILIFKAHLLISNMYGFLGLTHIYASFSFFLTFFTIIVIINAFNLIDGIDGLAGSLGLISSVVFGTFFLINENIPYALLGFSFAGSLVAFLIYNFQPAKIFMGDTGSLLLGVVHSILVIKFIQSGDSYTIFPVAAVPAIGFSILLLPLMDTLRVFGIRIFHGLSPFSADRNHIHHLLLDRGLTHKSITLICSVLSIVFTAAAFLLQKMGATWLLLTFISCFFIIIYSIKKIPVKVAMKVIRNENENLFKLTGKSTAFGGVK